MGEIWLCEIKNDELKKKTNGVHMCVAKISKQGVTAIAFKNFMQEMSIAYHIEDHPNIAKTLGYSVEPFLSILMPYYPLGSLDDLIQGKLQYGGMIPNSC